MLIHSTVLPNGLRVVVAEQPESPVIAAGVFVRQGSRNEKDDDNGISHFLEHLLVNPQRAIRREKQAVADLLNIGGILNAHTTKECTSFEGLALKQHASLLFQALYQLVFEADFTDDDVDAERQIILAELRRKLHGSDQLIDYLAQGIYGNDGYGRWILGTEAFISGVRKEQLYQCYSDHYVADNIALVILTSEDVRTMMPIVEDLFGQVPSGNPTPTQVETSEQVHLKVLKQKSDQVFLCLGGVAPSLRDEGSRAFEVAMAAWGAVPNSRLFVAAREKHGLVYNIQSIYHGYVQTGQWLVFSSVAKDKFFKLMDVLAEEVQRIREEPLDQVELNRTVSVLKTNLFIKFQQADFLLRLMGRREMFRESIYPNEMIREFELATPERIQQLASDYIRPFGLSLVVMGDLDTEQVLQAMNKMGE